MLLAQRREHQYSLSPSSSLEDCTGRSIMDSELDIVELFGSSFDPSGGLKAWADANV